MVGRRRRSRNGGVGRGTGDDGFTGGLGELILNIVPGDLGDSVAVLHLYRDLNDLGVVDTVLSGNLAAGVLHGFSDRVGNARREL